MGDESIEDIPGQTFSLGSLKPYDRAMMRRPFPPSYNEAMYGHPIPANGPSGPEQSNAFDVSSEQDAPPYSSIHQDPVISYPVATLGRLVLPQPPHYFGNGASPSRSEGPGTNSCNTLPSMIRRAMRDSSTRFSLQLSLDTSRNSNSSSFGSQRLNCSLSPASGTRPTSDSEPELTQTAV